jgi:hypothetical protein
MSDTKPTYELITDPLNLFESLAPIFNFAKPDLAPGAKGYYEIDAVQVDAAYIEANGDKVVTKEQPEGQTVAATDWIITKTEADGTSQRWTMWDETNPLTDDGKGAKFQARWKAVEGKAGKFSPKSVPTPMVEMKDAGSVKTGWGTPGGPAGSFLVQYGKQDYNVITREDLAKTYLGMDDASVAKMDEIKASLA